MMHTQFKCLNCLDSCDVADSREVGKNTEWRKEVVCADAQRNMERRIENRKAAEPNSSLIQWWSSLSKNKEKTAERYRGIKRKAAGDKMTDDEVMRGGEGPGGGHKREPTSQEWWEKWQLVPNQKMCQKAEEKTNLDLSPYSSKRFN